VKRKEQKRAKKSRAEQKRAFKCLAGLKGKNTEAQRSQRGV